MKDFDQVEEKLVNRDVKLGTSSRALKQKFILRLSTFELGQLNFLLTGTTSISNLTSLISNSSPTS